MSNNPELLQVCFDKLKENTTTGYQPAEQRITITYTLLRMNQFQMAIEVLLESGADPMSGGPGNAYSFKLTAG